MANPNEPETTAVPGDAGQGATVPGGEVPGGGAPGPAAHTGAGDVPQPVAPPSPFHIRLDRQDVEVSPASLSDGTLTGHQIRELATPPIAPDRDLFEIVPGGSDKKIGDEDTVAIRDHIRFFSAPRNINPGATDGLARSASPRYQRCQGSLRRAAH